MQGQIVLAAWVGLTEYQPLTIATVVVDLKLEDLSPATASLTLPVDEEIFQSS